MGNGFYRKMLQTFVTTTLSSLRRGQTGIVEEIVAADNVVTRLAEMGIREGSFIRVLQPGAACAICAEDTRLVLRGEEAAALKVYPLS